MNPTFTRILAAAPPDRRDLFVTAARRLGTNERNVEKDFWVCWTLDALRRDYERMADMIFGPVPDFASVIESVTVLESRVNAGADRR